MSKKENAVVIEPTPEQVASWIIFTLRDVIANSAVRHKIITTQLGRMDGVSFGKDFNTPEEWATYEADLTKLLSRSDIILFTSSNFPDAKTAETHFQTFLVNPSKKTLLMIDPARKPSGASGIYSAAAAEKRIQPFFEAQGYTVNWILTDNTCQSSKFDVFCQTWSLYLLIEAFKNTLSNTPVPKLPIPRNQVSRYTLILEFFKQCVAIPEVCDAFKREWAAFTAAPDKAIYDGLTTAAQKKARKAAYAAIDPCVFLLAMTPDLMNP